MYNVLHDHRDIVYNVLMRDEKEERKKQASSNKQGKATQHTQGSHFSLPRVGLEPTTLYTPDIYMYRCAHYMAFCLPQFEGGDQETSDHGRGLSTGTEW